MADLQQLLEKKQEALLSTVYNGYICRDSYFPKNDDFNFFPFLFSGLHMAALILSLGLMLRSVLAPEHLLQTTVCVLNAYVQNKKVSVMPTQLSW